MALLSLSPSHVMKRSNAAAAAFGVSAIPMSCRSDLALSCRDLGRTWVTFAVLCTPQRGSRGAGQTSRSTVQTPSTPSPTAKSGAVNPGMTDPATDPASCQRSCESHPEPLNDTYLEIDNEWRPHDERDDQTPNDDLESLRIAANP